MTLAHVRKALTAALTAAGVLVVLLPDGMTPEEWYAVAVAGLGAVGVYAVPNRPLP